jgi:diguanylate cyclase (GGDEF)-like protein/PAS domain S-box-containing protein
LPTLSGAQYRPEPGRASEDRFRYLVENAFDVVVECAVSGRILYVSPNIADVLGHEPSAIVGTFLVDLLHPDDVGAGTEAFSSAAMADRQIHATLRYRHVSGRWRSIEGRGKAYTTAEGKSRVVVIGRDVTDRVNAEIALRQLLRRIELQVEQTPAAVIVWDLQRRVAEWNPGAEKTFGYSKDEILGKPIDVLFPSTIQEADEFMQSVQNEVVKSHEPLHMTAVNLKKSGERVTCEWVAVPLLDDSRAVTGIMTIADDLSELHRARRLEDLAYQDPVTGMPNRRYFDDRLSNCADATRRYNDAFAVLYIDLDDFKAINDSHGHHTGDAVLAAVGLRLRVCVRDTDVVARLGGDEFGVLLTHLERNGYAEEVAERILQSMRHPLTAGDKTFKVSASIGLSTYPADGTDAATLLRKADAAMYRAKQKGRSTYSV